MTALDIFATGGKCQDVADGGNAAQASQENPPRRQAFAAATTDDLGMLREIGNQDADEDE